MYSMSLTIRKDGNGWFVDGETSDPALAAGTRVSAPLELDVRGTSQLPARDLDEVRAYGMMLGEAVFVGDIGAAFHDVLGRVPHGDVLHVSLSVEDVELRSLRWERLCCPLHNRQDSPWEFLHLRQETAYSLDLRSAIDLRYPAISRVGLKALVVVADMGSTRPHKLAEFDAAETVAGIRTALGKDILCHILASSGVLQPPNTDGLPTLDEICRWLTQKRFAILHLVCHGEFKQWEEPDKDGKLVTKSDTFLYLRKSGEVDPMRKDDHVARVSGTDFLQRLRQCQALPHLTFLCSCSSASSAAEQGLGGLGQRLVRELAMPAVVAMTEPVPIDLATEISTEFYHYLRQTGEVDRALTKASASQAGRPTVLVPTHFSRLAGRRLFDDNLELTSAEWEHGLQRLPALIQERAPVLATICENLLKVMQPALGICRIAEHSKNTTDDDRRARDTLLLRKAELNELCEDFLENSFDHLAKDRPLAFPSYNGQCPFPGLGVFDKVKTGDKEEDFRPFFFGRDLLIREIRELVTKNRFAAVLGGSGTGKSSLIRAGLLKVMRQEKPELQAIVFPPGKDPLVRLQNELAAAPNPDILVVDQFEELFTLCTDPVQRKEFLKQLLPMRDRIPIVITMRADFLGECAGHDDLHELLDAAADKHLKLIQPLKGNELRSVVEQQAQAVGLRFEPGLAASIFDDLECEPGAMPLLQHCLRQLWQNRHGRWLRLAEYANEDRVGGVKGAISRTAEDVYQQLAKDVPDASTLLPFIFERLARIDTSATDPEQRRDTRRREELSELTPASSDTQLTKLMVTKLADAKLVVTTQNPQTHETEVEVAHEALIRNWPRLQTWFDAARDTARLVERIRSDADTYHTTPSPDNLTLRGSALAESSGLLTSPIPRLSADEASFVRSCQAEETSRLNANTRRLRITIGVLLAFSLLVSGLALLAVRSSWIANAAKEESRKRFVRMSTVSGIAARERGEKVAAAHFFVNAAVESTNLTQRDHLNMAAFHMVEHVSLQTILSHRGVTGVLPLEDSQQVLSWGRDGNIKLWDMEGNQIGNSMPHAVGKPIWDVVPSEDMSIALSSSRDDTIRLWNLRTQDLIGIPLPHNSVRGAKFIAGERIFSWSKEDLKVWDLETQKELRNPGIKLEGDLREIVFSPGNERVFAWSDDQLVVWDFKVNSSIFPGLSLSPTEHLVVIGAKFLNRDLLAVWDESNNLHIFNLAEQIKLPVLTHDGLVKDCQFREEGKKLLTWSEDHKARLWDISSGTTDKTFDCGFDDISGAMFHQHKEHFLSWSSNGAIRFWDLAGGPPSIVNHFEIVGAKLVPKDKLLTWSSDGNISLWDSHMPKTTFLHAKMHHAELVKGAEATEQNIFTWSEGDGSVRIWQIEPQRRIELRHSLVIGAESIEPQNVITWGGVDNVSANQATAGIRVWDTGNPQLPFREFHVESSIEVCKAIKSKRILIGCRNGDVVLWEDGSEIWRRKLPNAIREFRFSKDNTYCLILTQDGNAFVWRENAPELSTIDLSSVNIFDGAFADNQSLLLCTDIGIFAVSLTGKPILPAKSKLEKQIAGGKVLKDGNSVIYWNEDGMLSVWSSTNDKTVVDKSIGFTKVSFSPNDEFAIAFGRKNAYFVDLKQLVASPLAFHANDNSGAILSNTRIVTWAENEIQLSNLPDLSPIAILTHQGRIHDVQISADKSIILSSSEDRTSRMWDAETGDLLLVFDHDAIVKGARFIGDTHQFVSWLEGDSVTIWNPSVPKMLDLTKRTGTTLTNAGRIEVMNAENWQSLIPKK